MIEMLPISIDFVIFSCVILFALCCFITMWSLLSITGRKSANDSDYKNDTEPEYDKLYVESEYSLVLLIVFCWVCVGMGFAVGWCITYFISR